MKKNHPVFRVFKILLLSAITAIVLLIAIQVLFPLLLGIDQENVDQFLEDTRITMGILFWIVVLIVVFLLWPERSKKISLGKGYNPEERKNLIQTRWLFLAYIVILELLFQADLIRAVPSAVASFF